MRTEAERAKMAAYMREYRRNKGGSGRGRGRPPKDVDRSKPDNALRASDPAAHHRQYMRWRRSDEYVRSRDPSPLVSAAPDSGG
jgi:hypothetical protein